MRTYQIGVMEGDGIGPEIVGETVKVLKAVQQSVDGLEIEFKYYPVGLSSFQSNGATLPEETVEGLKECDAGLLGPLTTHIYDTGNPNMINPSGALRKGFDLYANIRPTKTYEGVKTKFSDVDLVVVRENTEGMYADRNMHFNTGEFMPDPDTVLSFRVVTRKGSERLARVGFELAQGRKKKVTIVHKMNVLRKGCGLFYDSSLKVGKKYSDTVIDDYHIDAFAMHLIQRPEDFDVVVTTNMFGDILSDQAAGLVGGLGLAPGLNLGDSFLIAQATHGSAPDIAGRNIANPVAEILSAKMMLEWLGYRNGHQSAVHAASLIERAVEEAFKQKMMTTDLGGICQRQNLVIS
ncbi:isocitrate/isopropylmalate dehydrogenase family protein [Halalkalibacter krulwichiae]|uniref:Homoisocitrate dehydrogenase n=1 Tax=Halalkalibacter krulwichiae TaxID=199441 RepID=A0A1X9M8L9_9BACI|nr:isocitrate/isopropylmalate dehydrogenase family protein [Halalkalibacter krulwichiae]ARK29765.1 Homoisocitrate dehydrogenase [Halalkalibacter krulwichiae]